MHLFGNMRGNNMDSSGSLIPTPDYVLVEMPSSQALSSTVKNSSWVSKDVASGVVYYTHTLYPIVLLVLFLVLLGAHGIITASADTSVSRPPSNVTGPGGKPLPDTRGPKDDKRKTPAFTSTKRLAFIWLSSGLILTFIGNGVNIILHALTEEWWCGEAAAIYVVGSGFLYSLFVLTIIDSTLAPTLVHMITWCVALIGEFLLFGATINLYTTPHDELNSIKQSSGKLKHASEWEIMEIVIDSTRILLLVLCVGLYVMFTIGRSSSVKSNSAEASKVPNEQTPLLNGNSHGHSHENSQDSRSETAIETVENGNLAQSNPRVNGSANANGDANGVVHGSVGPSAPAESAAFYRPTSAPARSWWEYIRGYSLFFPYLWPSKSTRLQITVIVCFIIVLLQRVVNILVPYQIGHVTNELKDSADTGEAHMPWLGISLLIIFKVLQGPSGVLGAARSVMWIPVAQFSYQALSTASFEHVHGLSLDFHLGKRTGEVLSALSKGAAINTFLEQVTFQVLPMLFDLGIAIGYFAIAFDSYYALTVGVVTFWYLYLTVRMAQWRAEQRRQMINADREEDAVKNDSIQSYETVKYFGAEEYEFDRYRDAVINYQKAEYSVLLSLNAMNITQNLVFMVGLLVVSFISAYQVTTGQQQVGQFVMLLTYMGQLQGPLNFFGTFYRSVQSAMISGERLLELFKEQPTVVDDAGAIDMPVCEGQIRFDNVKFSYDTRKPALESLSFTCPPGTTTALVGESGGGKSTIFRLLFRFYNFQDGSIQLDGNDVRDVTIKSLRSHIGVVPQDTVLFNETLIYNLRYANQNATDDEIFAACRAASIHDKIMTFPDKYMTKVGERGLRLSGGEKQRVAIARTILKNPRIIMLDEATAALDTETEQNIQEAFKTLSEGRTMLVIAHRLSTITSADQILVLHQGEVVENGTHEELLEKKGRYAAMWKRQIRAEEAAREAQVLSDRAKTLREESITRPTSRDGLTTGDNSDEDSEHGSITRYKAASDAAGHALSRAADGLRGAANILHGSSSDDRYSGKPAGHP